MNLKEVDFNQNWLALDQNNQLYATPKEWRIVRWVKHLIQILSCGCYTLYDHVRVDRVANVIFEEFQRLKRTGKEDLLEAVEHLLESRESIKTHRKELLRIRTEMKAALKEGIRVKSKFFTEGNEPPAKKRLLFD